jgi:GGDEF domain-containing protein
MKKKKGAAPRAAKRQKPATASAKAPQRRAAPASRRPAKADAKDELRRLKTQLGRANARIEELQAAAETDFLLGVSNRRGFERELGRAISYIQRYHASGALIMLDVDRLSFSFGGSTVGTGVSAGVALLGPHSEAARALGEADRAMYVRKAQRRHEVTSPLANKPAA